MAAESKPAKRVSGASAREFEGVIKSAKRVLELFEYFAECRRPLSVTDLVRGLDYPQSSASVLLKSLTRLGYLDYDRQKRLYRPTLRVALLGGWVHDQLFSHASLSHLIDDLHLVSGGEAVILGMQNDIYVQYIHLVQSRHQQVASWYIKPGSLRPLCRSAVGRILLSRKPDVEVQQLLWRINAEEEPHLRMHVGDLLKELDRIRRDGYAYTEGTVNSEVGVLAVEMPTPASQPSMALGIGGQIQTLRHERERYLALLREALQPYRASTSSGNT
ncbi:MAG: helix-turn-helix domain-containing protein [Proteobacteria bacterium]|nr:helix-turn-helix domain-containing protein [Pseudomonadota bacterium]